MNRNKTIYINARFLNQRITGVQRFALELSKRLKKNYGNKVRFVTHPGIIHEDLAKELDAQIIGFNRSHLWEQVDLYLFLLSKKKPLLLSFGYTGPLLYRRQIVSIHDMAFKYYKETFTAAFSMAYNLIVPKIAKKCLHVFTVSKSAREEVSKELKIGSNKITVIYNGISEVFEQDVPEMEMNQLKKERYILTVSSHHQRKNYKRLIRAFSKIDDPFLKLYVIGNKINTFSDDLNKDDYDIDNRIVFLSNVSDKELVNYYDNTQLFVFPSLYEGFGIPVIEAMRRGKTCVLSDIPVFKEIGDEQVVYVDPLDINSIKEGIEKGLRINKTQRIYKKLPNFSWDKSAEKVICVLNNYNNCSEISQKIPTA